MQGGAAPPIRADGFRPADGAIIDAKYVKNSRTTCFTPNNENGRADFIYQQLLRQQQGEIVRYGAVIQDPANQAHFVEIDTNDPVAALYFQVQMDMLHVKGKARYVP